MSGAIDTRDKVALESARKRIMKKAAKFGELMRNPMGRELIGILKDEFDREDLRGNDPYETYYNLGARDVIKYLETLQNIDDKTSEMK